MYWCSWCMCLCTLCTKSASIWGCVESNQNEKKKKKSFESNTCATRGCALHVYDGGWYTHIYTAHKHSRTHTHTHQTNDAYLFLSIQWYSVWRYACRWALTLISSRFDSVRRTSSTLCFHAWMKKNLWIFHEIKIYSRQKKICNRPIRLPFKKVPINTSLSRVGQTCAENIIIFLFVRQLNAAVHRNLANNFMGNGYSRSFVRLPVHWLVRLLSRSFATGLLEASRIGKWEQHMYIKSLECSVIYYY